MYRFETLKSDFPSLLAVGVVSAVAILVVLQLTDEIALPGEFREKPGEFVSCFALITVMIGFIAGAFRSTVASS